LLGQVWCERQDQESQGAGEGQVALEQVPGVDIKHARDISILDLVPGSKPIRLTIFSESAIEYMKSLQAPVHNVLEVIGK
jgi:hypothetical protein